jgi:uncharacterized protein (TIGR02217 family)
MFHDIRFPTAISFGARGGPERRTEIVALGSGREERNQRWADSKRRYEAGYGVKSLDDLYAVIAFFEERRGRFHGFRWKDCADSKSCPQSTAPAAGDQVIGEGDGATASFQLVKTYGSAFAPWSREITKPVEGTLLVAVDGTAQAEGIAFTCDYATGVITFDVGHIPADYNRPGGIEAGSPTSWTPESKPIWFTELGCPAVDKGSNQPNVFGPAADRHHL